MDDLDRKLAKELGVETHYVPERVGRRMEERAIAAMITERNDAFLVVADPAVMDGSTYQMDYIDVARKRKKAKKIAQAWATENGLTDIRWEPETQGVQFLTVLLEEVWK